MRHEPRSKFDFLLWRIKSQLTYWNHLFVIVAIGLVYLLVYFTQGIKFSFSHTMYLPILYAGLVLGWKWGIAAGVLAGIVLGPFMPIDTYLGEAQTIMNWAYRLFIFSSIGGLVGFSADRMRKNTLTIQTLLSTNTDTDIPNFNSIRGQFLSTIIHDKPRMLSILIGNYSKIIDILGYEIYAKAIKKLYQQLKTMLGEDPTIIQMDSDKLWVFTAVNDDVLVLDNIHFMISQPIKVQDIPIYMEIFIGQAIVESDVKMLEKNHYTHADIASRYAKNQRIPVATFERFMFTAREDIALLGEFQRALEENQTFMMYQPNFHIETGNIIGFEALIRWQHQTKGLIPPNQFVPLVEETHLIQQMTDWVFDQVLQMLTDFKKLKQFPMISINISTRNLTSRNFFERIMNKVEKHGIPTSSIVLEITESSLMMQPEISVNVLKQFHREGFLIAIDDFGKAYSSLSYLANFPVDFIKIDRYFTSRVTTEAYAKKIVESVVQLADTLKYATVAEGVENKETLDILKETGCMYAQGYYYERPLKKEDILSYFATHLQQ